VHRFAVLKNSKSVRCLFKGSQKKIINHLKNRKVTKAEVISEIAAKTGIDKSDVQTTVEAFFNVVKNSMADGNNIYVRGFGSFINKKRAQKIGRNISKKEAIMIEEHFIPSFKPSKNFVDQIKASKKVKEVFSNQ